ncbi:MAG: glycosidase [bacterium]|nr:glycosidase [bacterium]
MEFSRQVVLEPREIWWEKGGVFNPATVELGGKIHLLYRAVGSDHISRFGLAISEDGETFTRFDEPIFEGNPNNPSERLGVEDPRATMIGRDIFITYTAVSVYPTGTKPINLPLGSSHTPWRVRVSALKTRDMRSFQKLGVLLPDLDSKDAVIFPQKHLGFYWLIHRVDPSMFITRSRDLKKWEGNIEMMIAKEPWEQLKIGAACPPIEVEGGWLLLYHGVSSSHTYSVGAALLARENPAVVLKRTKHPVMSPHFDWERRGVVSNVVFPTGSIVSRGKIHLYYGGADKVVGLAKIPLENIMQALDES